MMSPLANQPPLRRLLDRHEVAARLGCSWRTVYRLADMGQIPPGVKLGGLRRWDSEEIDRFIENGCQMPAKPRAKR